MWDSDMLEESKGACGFDGYLKMNGAMTTDYTKMDLINEKEKESGRYLNQKQWRKEKADDIELQPLTGEDDADNVVLWNTNRREQSPQHVNTLADVHRNDDTDSGHSSTYVPGTSPPDTGDDGYLIPKTGPDGGFVKKNGNKKNKSIEFTQDYHEDRPPPTYSTVVEDSEIPV